MKRSTLELKKLKKLNDIKEKYKGILNSNPRVYIESLGFDVDGGRINKDDFKSKYDIMSATDTTTVRDADNAFHPDITKDQMKLIWTSIVTKGEEILNLKWTIESRISAIKLENFNSEEEAILALESIEI